MGHRVMVGILADSPYYHRPKRGAPWWATCQDVMFKEREQLHWSPEEVGRFQWRDLPACRECWPK